MATLRKPRLLFEEFLKNHNFILIGLPALLTAVTLSVNEDIRSRVTFSVINPDQIRSFILAELDRISLAHNTLSDEALHLIARSSEGVMSDPIASVVHRFGCARPGFGQLFGKAQQRLVTFREIGSRRSIPRTTAP